MMSESDLPESLKSDIEDRVAAVHRRLPSPGLSRRVMVAVAAAVALIVFTVAVLFFQVFTLRHAVRKANECIVTSCGSTVNVPGVPGAEGKQGQPGPHPTPAEIASAVSLYCGGGACGQLVSQADVQAAVAVYCAGRTQCAGRTGRSGPPGAAGGSPSTSDIAEAVAGYCGQPTHPCRGDAGSDGTDGPAGPSGPTGAPGSDGKDGQPPASYTIQVPASIPGQYVTEQCARDTGSPDAAPTYTCVVVP